MTVVIDLPDLEARRLRALAQALGQSAQEIVLASLLERLERERAFETTAQRVLAKNEELYRRLS